MLEIITNKSEWDKILKEIATYDFYHTYDYHQISKNKDEQPLLIVYKNNAEIIALPFLKREIPDTKYFDLTSVYGYTGPISKNVAENFDNTNFYSVFNDFLIETRVVSVFSRMNPYIEHQDDILKGIGVLDIIGNLVNIDLTLSLEESRAAYRKDTKSRVNKARRACSIKAAETKEEINSFIEIYLETMQKLEANDSYFFNNQYFFDFLKCEGFETDILLAIFNETGEVIAGSMFIKTNNIIQYHLSGTKSDFMNIAPSRILLDEMRVKGTELGFDFFNLGGGYQSKEDALFSFKSSFSKDIKQWKAWKYVVNESVYQELSGEKETSTFFPAYRS